MHVRPCTTYLNRSGGIVSLLFGWCGLCVAPVAALSSRHTSFRTAASRVWVGPKQVSAVSRHVVPTSGRCMFSAQEGQDGRAQDIDSKVKPGAVPKAKLEIHAKTPQEMEDAGAFFGTDSRGGDVVLLWGDLGTGKTCFARGFVRARVGDPGLAVMSPSYLLDNIYEVGDEDVTIHHMDLYRLRGGCDLHVLDIPRVLETSVCLIEWPDRLGAAQPMDRLDVHLAAVNEDERIITLTGHGSWWAGAVEDLKDEKLQRIT